ncbi:DUF2304 domain-containing protein [Patescibacteria group bacterium]|nr:DUF2304 domain-containing protein [Patescibacteria group bacterium]
MYSILDNSLTLRTQLFSIVGSILLLLIIINLIRREYLKEGYSLLWLLMGGLVLIFSLFNELLFSFSNFIGIDYAPAALFLVLIIGLMLISMHFSVAISKHEKRIKELAQENALLKSMLNKKERKRKTSKK